MTGETTGDLLMAASRGLRRRYLDLMAPYDLTPGKARALSAVCHANDGAGLRLSVLAEHLGIVPRSVTEVVDALEQRGLVRRVPDAVDRRAIVVEPTEEGRSLHGRIDAARRTEATAYLAVLGDDDRAELERILRLLLGD